MRNVVPSERLRHELEDVLNGITEGRDPIEAVAPRGARQILQRALEDEVTDVARLQDLLDLLDGARASPSSVSTANAPIRVAFVAPSCLADVTGCARSRPGPIRS